MLVVTHRPATTTQMALNIIGVALWLSITVGLYAL